jgi:hypothetical protein
MTSPDSTPAALGDADHGRHLAFRPVSLEPRVVVTLPGGRVGIDCPTVLHVSGPIFLSAGSVIFEVELRLKEDELRYAIETLRLSSWDCEINPEMVREVRWGQVFAAALEMLGGVVTFDEDGAELTHKSALTLSDEQRVGALWLQARLAGLEPNKHIGEQLGISPTAAAARVKRARQSGVIPPARQGQRR